METPLPIGLALQADEVAELGRPINGQGGFQPLQRQLQEAINPADDSLELTDELAGKVLRYLSYRPGGFEGRLAGAFRRNINNLMQ